jgi:hypothetical protein
MGTFEIRIHDQFTPTSNGHTKKEFGHAIKPIDKAKHLVSGCYSRRSRFSAERHGAGASR